MALLTAATHKECIEHSARWHSNNLLQSHHRPVTEK